MKTAFNLTKFANFIKLTAIALLSSATLISVDIPRKIVVKSLVKSSTTIHSQSTKFLRSAPPIPEGLEGGEAKRDDREQSINLSLFLDVLFSN